MNSRSRTPSPPHLLHLLSVLAHPPRRPMILLSTRTFSASLRHRRLHEHQAPGLSRQPQSCLPRNRHLIPPSTQSVYPLPPTHCSTVHQDSNRICFTPLRPVVCNGQERASFPPEIALSGWRTRCRLEESYVWASCRMCIAFQEAAAPNFLSPSSPKAPGIESTYYTAANATPSIPELSKSTLSVLPCPYSHASRWKRRLRRSSLCAVIHQFPHPPSSCITLMHPIPSATSRWLWKRWSESPTITSSRSSLCRGRNSWPVHWPTGLTVSLG